MPLVPPLFPFPEKPLMRKGCYGHERPQSHCSWRCCGDCSGLLQLAPYQPYFLAATVTCLGDGYWMVYRSNRFVMFGLVQATLLVTGALVFDLLAPLILKS